MARIPGHSNNLQKKCPEPMQRNEEMLILIVYAEIKERRGGFSSFGLTKVTKTHILIN